MFVILDTYSKIKNNASCKRQYDFSRFQLDNSGHDVVFLIKTCKNKLFVFKSTFIWKNLLEQTQTNEVV